MPWVNRIQQRRQRENLHAAGLQTASAHSGNWKLMMENIKDPTTRVW
jgi:hypothetical protein